MYDQPVSQMSPWFKIFALMIVGGVAKSLFGPQWRPTFPTVNQASSDGVSKSPKMSVDTFIDGVKVKGGN